MEVLANLDSVDVEQEVTFAETFSRVPVRHRYRILDPSGDPIAVAEEARGSELARNIFKGYRPFTVTIWVDGRLVLEVKRPVRIFRDTVRARDRGLRVSGSVVEQRSVTHHVYRVLDRDGKEVGVARGALVRPHRFEIRRNDLPFGTIYRGERKGEDGRSSDGDSFGVSFHPEFPAGTKALFLAAAFLIDFIHFERRPW